MALAHGVDAQYFGRVEASLDQAQVAWVAGDALSLIEMKLEPSFEFHKSKERRGSASLQAEIAGYQMGKWSAKCELRTNGLGVEPPMATLLRMLAGQAPTIVASTSVRYTFANAVLTGQLARYVPTNLYEQATGAWVEQLDIETAGNTEPVLTFSGGFARYGWLVGGAVASATVNSGATTFTLAATSRGKIGPNVRISIGSDTNTGAGYLVTAVNQSTGVVTFSPALGTTQSGPPAIAALVATPSYSGTLRGGIDHTFTLASTDYGINSSKTSIKTGLHGLAKLVTANRVARVARGDREVALDIEAYYLDEELARFRGLATSGAVASLTQRLGQTPAGEGMEIETPAVRLDVTPIDIPEAEEALIKFTGLARMSSASNDEIALMFD